MTDEQQLASINVNDTRSKRRLSFAETLAIVLISGQFIWYAYVWFHVLGDPSLKIMDFVIFYGTGRLIRAGEYNQIYDVNAQTIIQHQIVNSTYKDYKDLLVFNHPPHLTPLLALIASDDYVHAYIYWTIVRLLVMVACVELIRRYLLRSAWDLKSAWLGALGAITYFPIFISLLGGQDTIFTLIGLLIWMFALLKHDEISAGLGLALATLTPTLAGALAFPLFASRRRAGLWFIAGMLGLALYSLLLVGSHGLLDLLYLFGASSQGAFIGFNWSVMYNLLGLLVRTFPALNMDTVRSIVWISAVLSILSMCIMWWNKGNQIQVKHIAIAVVLGTFTAPHLYLHALSYLLLPLLGLITLIYDHGHKSIALILIPVVSSLLIFVGVLLQDWIHALYYLLMFAMVFCFIVIKPSSMPQKSTG